MKFIKNIKFVIKGFLHIFKSGTLIEPLNEEEIKHHYKRYYSEDFEKFNKRDN